MTSKELNLKVIEYFPQIKDIYYEETSWQDGNETGSHIVFGDVLTPFIKKQLNECNLSLAKQIFEFIENILNLDDKYANEVIAFSVLESLIFDEEITRDKYIQFCKVKTLKMIEEIISNV